MNLDFGWVGEDRMEKDLMISWVWWSGWRGVGVDFRVGGNLRG